MHPGDDLAGQRQQVLRGGRAPVGEGERVLGGDAGGPAAVALGEARLVDQPGRGGLGVPLARRVGGRLHVGAEPLPHRARGTRRTRRR